MVTFQAQGVLLMTVQFSGIRRMVKYLFFNLAELTVLALTVRA